MISDSQATDADEESKLSFYYISNIILAVLCSVTALAVTWITVKVTRIVRDSDRLIPAMLIFLDLSLLGKLIDID